MYQHKNIKSLSLFIALLSCVSLLAGCASSDNYKTDIFELVETQNAVLLADITENDFTDSLALEGIESVEVLEHCVSFYCGGYGISTSSHEFGFYYSFDDQPLGVWENVEFCLRDELTEDGNGFSGDLHNNSYYTEMICDHFWYYEVHL